MSGARATTSEVAIDRRIEESGLNQMHSRRQLFYDGWLLFLSPGRAKRGRSVNAHFGSTLPLDVKIGRCAALYQRHGLAQLFRITPFSQPADLDRALDARGYLAFGRTLVQSATLASPPEAAARDDLDFASPMPEAFVEAVGEMRGSPPDQRSAHLERIAQSPLDLRTVIARRDGVTVAAGLLAVDGDIAGLFDIVTADDCRGQGYGTAVSLALLARAWERGVGRLFLQVEADNAPALAIYRKFGFATRYAYHYRGLPGECQ